MNCVPFVGSQSQSPAQRNKCYYYYNPVKSCVSERKIRQHIANDVPCSKSVANFKINRLADCLRLVNTINALIWAVNVINAPDESISVINAFRQGCYCH